MSKMIPRPIMAAGLSVSCTLCAIDRSSGCATLAPVHHPQEGSTTTLGGNLGFAFTVQSPWRWCTTTTSCGWAWPYVQPIRDGVVLTDLDSSDQRIRNAIKAIEHELVRHQVVKMRIP